MVNATITVTNATGLHTRPGTQLVQLAQKFQSDIILRKQDREANAKSIIKVMKIGISQGDMITIEAAGCDESDALSALTDFIRNLTE
jgi:phosphocarrier protein HPr